jgi:hypothetical protein
MMIRILIEGVSNGVVTISDLSGHFVSRVACPTKSGPEKLKAFQLQFLA